MHITAALLPALATSAVGAVIRRVSVPPSRDGNPWHAYASTYDSPSPSNIPLLIWHGLGDAFDADGIQSVGKLYEEIYPGSSVYSIHLADDTNGDRQATWLGDINEQLSSVCDALASEPTLSSAEAVNAVGFSQGGQFLRGLVERCNAPPVRNLLTFGSQHNGIAAYQTCEEGSWFCRFVNGIAKGNTWGWPQTHLVPAQYFRDPEDLQSYLEHSNFLADINNEREKKNARYIANLESLNRFIMVIFNADTTVVPKESGWFAEVNVTSGQITPLRERTLYKEDWLGLKTLDEQGALVFETTPGRHMNVTEEVLRSTFGKWFDPKSRKHPSSLRAEDL